VSSDRLMDKAERALEAAKRALDSEDTETAADRAYYAVYESLHKFLQEIS